MKNINLIKEVGQTYDSNLKIVEKQIETNKEVNIVETSIKKEKITVL